MSQIVRETMEAALQTVMAERERLNKRLAVLQSIESAISSYLELSSVDYASVQLPLTVVPVTKPPTVGRTPISRLIISELGSGKPRTLKELCNAAINVGIEFGDKKPGRVLHWALIGMSQGGYVKKAKPKTWQITEKGRLAISDEYSNPSPNGRDANTKVQVPSKGLTGATKT